MVNGAAKTIGALTATSRRGFIGRCAALPVAAAATTVATSAIASARVRTFKGLYAIDGNRIVDGFFAAPPLGSEMDLVVVIPANGRLDAAAEATARSYAAQGWMAIAPNLPSTYKGAAMLGKPAMVAALMRDIPRFKRFHRGNGTVRVVAA